MASSGKKSKKAKKVSMTLTQFLYDVPNTPIRKTTNWADEVEDESDTFEPRPKPNIVLPTAPRAARVPTTNDANIPQDPPYVAYISNLTYDVDDNDLKDFFGNLKIANIRLPREDREPGKLRGFGYIEFNDRNNLIQAMALSDTSLKGRRMRIEVSTNDEKKRGGGRMDMGSGRDRPDRSESSSGDWRSGPRQESSSFQDPPSSERRSGFNNRDRDTYEPPSSNKPGAWRDANNDRPPAFRDNRDNRDDRRSDRGGYGGRRNYNDREEGFSRREPRGDDNTRSESSEPRTRPKLVLAPRKEPISTEAAPAPTTPAAPSIFGAAKPVDTSARERQIEERLARERDLKAAEIKKEAEVGKVKEDAEKEISRPPVVENSWRAAPREEPSSQDVSRRDSPVRRRDSPPRRDNSRRRDSPRRGGDSPQRRRDSPSRRRDSPPRRRDSPPRRRDSPPRRRDSSPRRRDSSPRRRDGSPIRRRDSPHRKRDGPPPARRNDDRRGDDRRGAGGGGPRSEQPTRGGGGGGGGSVAGGGERDRAPAQRSTAFNNSATKGRYDDKPHKDRNNVETKERTAEDRMPKLKEQEPPNFAASNKYAFLDTEDDSD